LCPVITSDDEFVPTLRLLSRGIDLEVGASMDVFEIKVKATVSEAYRVIAKDEHEAKKMAGLMFCNENRHQILATEFDVRPENDQSPVTSHQSPVTSHQSPVTSHQWMSRF
jgi:hypothetical protein